MRTEDEITFYVLDLVLEEEKFRNDVLISVTRKGGKDTFSKKEK
jgi:hypothetical protein